MIIENLECMILAQNHQEFPGMSFITLILSQYLV